MLRGRKSDTELRFELLTWGAILLAVVIIYVIFQSLEGLVIPLMLFFPGLILLGSAIYQDMQMEWRAGWLSYVLAILVVATGLAGIINALFGETLQIPWPIIAVAELGAVLIAKALYDPNPRD